MKITYIGIGNMGAPMTNHLSQAGHDLTIYNRTYSKSQAWIKQHPNHKITLSAEEACKECEVLILCVGNDQDVEQLIFGEKGAANSLKPGTLVIDHTTTSSDLAKQMHRKLNALQIDYVDAPVSGGQQGATNGQLTIMCGGDPIAAEKAQIATQSYSKSFTHMGEIGSGQLTKMVNQICVAGLIQALAEGMHFGQQAGLNMDKVMNTLSQGAASSWQMQNRHQTMNNGEYDFGFAVDHMKKDLEICLASAQDINADLPITSIVNKLYTELQNDGHGKLDTSSLLLRLQHQAVKNRLK
ncbi:NAD(P)-dependent oxidoreductase [Oceaniserpentilla sp. 4NH20-0058]|uniref:NAD(P)-dependent oxidoreductase n=1 Tax=Oceaniserpentilla sp. 4NH20-0058 TaxID=3127660 RepID=UPI003101BB53